ncbi:MAG: hypothetical protein WDO24_30905 [Pseudomonadota bacterium]
MRIQPRESCTVVSMLPVRYSLCEARAAISAIRVCSGMLSARFSQVIAAWVASL